MHARCLEDLLLSDRRGFEDYLKFGRQDLGFLRVHYTYRIAVGLQAGRKV